MNTSSFHPTDSPRRASLAALPRRDPLRQAGRQLLLLIALGLLVAGASVASDVGAHPHPESSPSPLQAGGATKGGGAEDDPVLHAYRLEHQSAFEALQIVGELLSEQGTVEFKPRENTLVLRDSGENIGRIVEILDQFDHPRRAIEVEIQIVQASSERFSPAIPETRIPERLLAHLRDLLPYHTYRLIAGTRLRSREGEQVSYQLGERFRVEFQIGTLLDDRRLRLRNFKVVGNQGPAIPRGGAARGGVSDGWELRRQRGAPKPMIHTTLNLHLGRTLYLGLAPSETSKEALMLMVTATHGPAASGIRVKDREQPGASEADGAQRERRKP